VLCQSYLEALHNCHEDWLIRRTDSSWNVPSADKVLVCSALQLSSTIYSLYSVTLQPRMTCIQPVIKPVVQPGLTNEQWLFVQHGCQTVFVIPVWQPVVSCKRGITVHHVLLTTFDSSMMYPLLQLPICLEYLQPVGYPYSWLYWPFFMWTWF